MQTESSFSRSKQHEVLTQVAVARIFRAAVYFTQGEKKAGLADLYSGMSLHTCSASATLLDNESDAVFVVYYFVYREPEMALSAAIDYMSQLNERLAYDGMLQLGLSLLYGLAEQWHKAFLHARSWCRDHEAVARFLSLVTDFFIDAAADDQAEAALDVLKSTPAAKAVEPVIVALEEVSGHPTKAPQEIMEAKDDVLARIEARRLELPILRAQLEALEVSAAAASAALADHQ